MERAQYRLEFNEHASFAVARRRRRMRGYCLTKVFMLEITGKVVFSIERSPYPCNNSVHFLINLVAVLRSNDESLVYLRDWGFTGLFWSEESNLGRSQKPHCRDPRPDPPSTSHHGDKELLVLFNNFAQITKPIVLSAMDLEFMDRKFNENRICLTMDCRNTNGCFLWHWSVNVELGTKIVFNTIKTLLKKLFVRVHQQQTNKPLRR